MNNNDRFFYKAVSCEEQKDGTILRSSLCLALHDRFRVWYELDQKTFPKIGKLFVFSSGVVAEEYIYPSRHSLYAKNGWLEVWECEVDNPIPVRLQRITSPTQYADMEIFWSVPVGKQSTISRWIRDTHVPGGTWWADAVTLKRLIKDSRTWN